MGKINYYKLAPTRLYSLDGESKVFRTQEEVNKAWEEGWFGPPWLVKDAPLISEMDWDTKQDMIDAVRGDPRYDGLGTNKNNTVEVLMEKIRAFEGENDVGGVVALLRGSGEEMEE